MFRLLQNNTAYLGATMGRVESRIRDAKFSLNGTEYKLVSNDGNNTLHGNLAFFFLSHISDLYILLFLFYLIKFSVEQLLGGSKGFSNVVWNVTKHHNKGLLRYIMFTYHSRDGEEGKHIYTFTIYIYI